MSGFLEISELSTAYGNRTILHSLSLEVGAGELLGVIGPNGCGKSTLIKTVSGTLKPKSGEVRLEGRNLLKMKAEERAKLLGVVAQNPSLPPAYTAAEIVMFGRTPHLKAFQQEGPE
ncbi:MAG: ABC transporter ATP-binding protein, partial [Chloroflexota bacterium]